MVTGAACNLARQRFDEVRASLNMLLWVLEQSTPHVRKAFRAEAWLDGTPEA
jgi:hypothetical protein